MAEMVAVRAATGLMGSVISKLSALLGEKYQLTRDVERGIRFLKDELSSMDAVLHKLEDKDDDHIDSSAKDWRSKVRELSYDIEDCIDRFMLNHSSQGGSKANFVRKAMCKVKMLLKDQGIADEIQELKRLVVEESERAKRYVIHQCLSASPQQQVRLDPRAHALFEESRDLVGINGPREEIIKLLEADEEKQHKVVSIYGTAGQGKTTLAMEVYRKIPQAFDCWAFISVSRTPDMVKLLRDILSQISKNVFDQSERLETVHQLIRTIKEYLKDKRYFILIDDIWEEEAWELVRSALPCNGNGSRILTTTRIKAVARSCCSGISEQMYEAKPLSDDNSQILFFKRLFWLGEECPPDLRKVSSEILRKCAGLPLAIISIAGLLANRSQTEEVWANTLRSISAAVDKDSPIDRMKRVLLLSYFDLPHHLKNCLLYLSVFPEDHLINCRQLILLWVAEGLIPGQDRESMEQLAKSYLNELINRSLVQPTNVGVDGVTVKECKVHDVILEFIVSKAIEDNFVTIWNRNGFSANYYSYKIRRLSIQADISGEAEEMAKTIKNAAHIRSISIIGSNSVLANHASVFLSSQVLRVLNVKGEVEKCYLGHVKSFGQLKYLSLSMKHSTKCKLPEDIEKLQYLGTLDVRWAGIKKLSASITQLKKLVRLKVHESVQLPEGIGNLQALEEISWIGLSSQSTKFVQGLGDLTNLRVLGIDAWHYSNEAHDVYVEGHRKACVSSFSKLFISLRELRVADSTNTDALLPIMASCGATPPLRRLLLLDGSKLNTVPHQISLLVSLTRLYIAVCGEVSKDGINILASLPMLLSLTVGLLPEKHKDGDSGILRPRHVISRQGFQRLLKFTLRCWREAALEFEAGAMPTLQRLKLEQLPARCQLKYGQGGLVLGLHNLTRLKHVAVDINCGGASADEVEALSGDIRSAAATHPNHPVLQLQKYATRSMRNEG